MLEGVDVEEDVVVVVEDGKRINCIILGQFEGRFTSLVHEVRNRHCR
jgi:hypothetical protein